MQRQLLKPNAWRTTSESYRMLLVVALFVSGCSSPTEVSTPAANPNAPVGIAAPMPRLSGQDAPTRKTNEQLAAVGADNTDALKPMEHGGMDHSEMERGAEDHSRHGATPAGTGKRAFVCPMHPEVKSDRPGNCPRCGMTLKPKLSQPGAAAHEHH